MRPTVARLTALALAALASAQLSAAEEVNGARTRPGANAEPTVERFIVKLRASSQLSVQAAAGNGESAANSAANALAVAQQRITALAARANMTMSETHAIGPSMHVMQVSPVARGEAMTQMLSRLAADSEVEYAVPDRRVYPHAVPNDPLFLGQWYLKNAEQPASINAVDAWDTTKGSDNVVIAVIDTGVRFDHPDLTSRFLPGYDFVSPNSAGNFKTANDGDGRDADAMDPGDWVSPADACGNSSNSSWHGTRVSGIIGAMSDNGIGVSGITWSGKILPVRVLGKCGGFNSDVLAGLNWAGGVNVPGAPVNTTPAKVLNVSLGGEGLCDSASADVISMLAAQGVLVVVSAGNEGGPVDSPANCPGAMGIAGLRHAGTKVGFSSLGPEIKLSAPGGNCVDLSGVACTFSLDTTVNSGTTVPAANTYTDKTNGNRNIGTSFSAPIVSGIAGLMLAVNSNLKATQLIARMQEGATKPFPTTSETPNLPTCRMPDPFGSPNLQNTECVCTTAVCGAGIANAKGSVLAALRPIANPVVQGAVTPGASLTLQGSSSTAADGRTIASYSWMKGGVVISNTSTASVMAPTSGSTTVCLSVTDDAGKEDSAKVVLTSSGSTVATQPPGTNACISEVSIVVTDASAAESGDTGTFTLTRSGEATATLAVTIAMSGTAVNGTGYQNVPTIVNFPAGAASATVTITPIDNSVADGSKTVIATVQAGSGYTAGSPNSATVTISDNEAPPPQTNPPSSGGGGGGAVDALVLMGLFLAVLAMLGRTHLPRHAKQLRQYVAAEQRRTRR